MWNNGVLTPETLAQENLCVVLQRSGRNAVNWKYTEVMLRMCWCAAAKLCLLNTHQAHQVDFAVQLPIVIQCGKLGIEKGCELQRLG